MALRAICLLLCLAGVAPRILANQLEPPKLPWEFALLPTAGFAEKRASLGLWFPYGTSQRPVVLAVSVMDTSDTKVNVSDLNLLQKIDQKILSQRRSTSQIKTSKSAPCTQDSAQLCFESVYHETFYDETIRERTYFLARDSRHTIVVTLSFPTYISHKVDAGVSDWLKTLEGGRQYSSDSTRIFNEFWNHIVPVAKAESINSLNHSGSRTRTLPEITSHEATVGVCKSVVQQSSDCIRSAAKGFFIDGLGGDVSFLGSAAKEAARFAGSTNPITGIGMRYAGIKTTQQQLQEGGVKIASAFKKYGATVVDGIKEFSKNPTENMSIVLDKVRQILGNITCQQASSFVCETIGLVGYEVAITALIGIVTAGTGVGAKAAQLVAEVSARYGPQIAANVEKFLSAISKHGVTKKGESTITDTKARPLSATFGPDVTKRRDLVAENVPASIVDAYGGPDLVPDDVINAYLPSHIEPFGSASLQPRPPARSAAVVPGSTPSVKAQVLSRGEQARILGLAEDQIEAARAGGVPEFTINELASSRGQARLQASSKLISKFMDRHDLGPSDGIVLMEDDAVMLQQARTLQERFTQTGKEPPVIIAGHGSPTDLLLDYAQTEVASPVAPIHEFSNERIGGFELLNVITQLGITVKNRDIVYLSCHGGNACGLSRVLPTTNIYSAPDTASVFSNSGGFNRSDATPSESWKKALDQYKGPPLRSEGSIWGDGMIEWNNGRINRQLGD